MYQAKKLAAVLATSTSVTASLEADASAQASKALQRVPCIWYPVRFQEGQLMRALIDSGSEVNAITPAYAVELGFTARKTSVGDQKIDGSPLETYGMASASFSLQNSLGRVRFFEETFLLADTSIEVVLGIPFLSLSNADVEFAKLRKLTWRSYTTVDALPTISRVELIDKREFAKAALDENSETFVVHVATLEATTIHPSRAAQIAALKWDNAPTEIPAEYSDYIDIFSSELVMELLENTGMNEHAIKLIDDKQPPYGPIYTLRSVELETLKAYIETYLRTGFIRPSKSPADALILFDKKPNGSLRLYVDYQGLNNLTIKNQYPLPLIGEALDCLSRAKRFTQLDRTSAYHHMGILEGDECKTAFCTRYRHFEYQVMPFGLSNAPASFQGYINKLLAKKLDIFVVVYLDDILIYTEDPGRPHVDAVWWVLEQLRKHGLYANLKKCRFHEDEVWFLGFFVSA